MPLQLLQQGGVFVEPHERLAEAGGQVQDSRRTGPLVFHELDELLTVTQTYTFHAPLQGKCFMTLLLLRKNRKSAAVKNKHI